MTMLLDLKMYTARMCEKIGIFLKRALLNPNLGILTYKINMLDITAQLRLLCKVLQNIGNLKGQSTVIHFLRGTQETKFPAYVRHELWGTGKQYKTEFWEAIIAQAIFHKFIKHHSCVLASGRSYISIGLTPLGIEFITDTSKIINVEMTVETVKPRESRDETWQRIIIRNQTIKDIAIECSIKPETVIVKLANTISEGSIHDLDEDYTTGAKWIMTEICEFDEKLIQAISKGITKSGISIAWNLGPTGKTNPELLRLKPFMEHIEEPYKNWNALRIFVACAVGLEK